MNTASSTLLIGWDRQDITVDGPIELTGQYYQRISERVRDPLSLTALALEQQVSGGVEQAVMVSIDISFLTADFESELRDSVRSRVPGLDPKRVILNSTHTHSASSYCMPFRWWNPAPNVVQPDDIRIFLLKRATRAVENAWNARKAGGISASTAYAAIGFSRRTLHADGRAVMYGDPSLPDFIGMEAGTDPAVHLLYTWDEQKQLTGVLVNVACPSQVMESEYCVSADIFGEVRKRIRDTFGEVVHMLGHVAPSGDLSPRDLPFQSKDEANYWKESGLVVLGERLARAVEDGYKAASNDIQFAPVFKHTIEEFTLPLRLATEAEYQNALADVKRITAGFPDAAAANKTHYEAFIASIRLAEKTKPYGPYDDKDHPFVLLENANAVITRHDTQDKAATYPVELHALRIGDFALITNPFELYVDFGHMIQARSSAKKTFLLQLAGPYAGYLPTARATTAGGYGSFIISGYCGADAGMELVERTLKAIDSLWA